MINRQTIGQFEAKKYQSNSFCRFNQMFVDQQYIVVQKNVAKRSPLEDKTNECQTYNQKANNQVVNLQDLWDQLAVCEQKHQQEKAKIQVSIMNVEPDQICQFTLEQFQCLAAQQNTEELKVQADLNKDTSEQPQDFGDLWQEVQKQASQNTNKNNPQNCEEQNVKKQSNLVVLNSNQLQKKKEIFDLNELLSSKHEKSLNYNISKDYLIYDYHKFVVNIFQTNIHSYFGFHQSPSVKNTYFLYNLITKENIIECFIDKCDQFLFTNKNSKADYQTSFCMKFKLCKTNYHFATAFHKYSNNGILYNLKPYNSYQNQYEGSFALIQINDGFIGNNCFCNTNVYISQKYTTQPGQLKMNITMKNGYLIANMGVNGVKSAPYNCRIQNSQSNFVYLLGLIDKQSRQFIVRVGEGMSPLIAFAISVGRKRYIESFTG